MKKKYEIGEEVFCIINSEIKKVKIKTGMNQQNGNIWYTFEGYPKQMYHEDYIFKSIQEYIENIKKKFSGGD